MALDYASLGPTSVVLRCTALKLRSNNDCQLACIEIVFSFLKQSKSRSENVPQDKTKLASLSHPPAQQKKEKDRDKPSKQKPKVACD